MKKILLLLISSLCFGQSNIFAPMEAVSMNLGLPKGLLKISVLGVGENNTLQNWYFDLGFNLTGRNSDDTYLEDTIQVCRR